MTTPEPAELKPKRRCIDGGACHHECEPQYCFRKETSLPLSASGLGDDWETKTDDPPAAPVAEDAVEALALLFHDTYERLAPEYGYSTREDTRIFDAKSDNGRLMLAVCKEVLEKGYPLRRDTTA